MSRCTLFASVLAFAAGAATSAAIVLAYLPKSSEQTSTAREPAANTPQPPAEPPAKAAAPERGPATNAPRLAVAPPPHEAPPDEAWVYLGHSQRQAGAFSDDPWKLYGLEWRVKVGVRRLASTGRDVIDLQWSLRYFGLRPPLMIIRPSLIDSWPEATQARIYAYPPGAKKGRRVVFTVPFTEAGASRIIFEGPPAEWYLTVPKGETETGTETILVDDLKKELLTKYPAEFSTEKPPKLYAELNHNPSYRGVHYFDLWTGELQSDHLEVPDLKTW